MKCRICGEENSHREYVVREMMFGLREAFHYFQCGKCECLQIVEIPTDLSRYYPANYYAYQPTRSGGLLRRWMTRQRDRFAVFGQGVFGRFLHARFPNIPLMSLGPVRLTRQARILDVGCGNGDLLACLRSLGFEHLLGVEPWLAEPVRTSNGVQIVKKTLQEVDGDWDLIMFHHSFEHVTDPVGTLQHVSRLLKPNGHCLIRMPTVSSYAWEHYRTDWVQLDAPRHLHVHSKASIGIAAASAGLTVERIVYDSTSFQFWGSEQYRKGIPLRSERSYAENPEQSLFSTGEIRSFAKRAAKLNAMDAGDQAAFYLRKPSRLPA